MTRKILVMGLPGAGKTTIARLLAPRLSAVLFNADEVRKNINKDLTFSPGDRVEQAFRMGWLCDQVVKAGHTAIADFVCPTKLARNAFACDIPAMIVFADRIARSRYEDTNKLFEPPDDVEIMGGIRVREQFTADFWVDVICRVVQAERANAV